MALCSRREYCISDIRSKLEQWGVGGQETGKILSELVRQNFINEDRYSRAFVRDKFNYNKWGRVKIAAHLKSKSVPGEIIRQALECIDDEAYLDALKEMLRTHKRSIRAKNQYDLKGKLLRFGLSRGFESHLLYGLLNDPAE